MRSTPSNSVQWDSRHLSGFTLWADYSEVSDLGHLFGSL